MRREAMRWTLLVAGVLSATATTIKRVVRPTYRDLDAAQVVYS
jgi:hypothetical protein